MGIHKDIEQPTGIVIKYFNVARMDFYPLEKILDVVVNGYISEEARRAKKAPAWTWGARLELKDELANENPTRADVYEYIKTHDIFKDAVDAI